MKILQTNALKLQITTFISNFGDGLHTLAIGQALYEKTGSVASLGAVITLNYLFGIFCQLYAGPWADRFPRKLLLIVCDVARGFCVLALAFGIYSGQPDWLMIALSVLIKIGAHIYRPAYFAIVSEAVTVKQIASFNSKNVACIQGGQLAGMAFFGLLYAFGPALVFLVDACTFFIAALIVSTVKIVPSLAQKKAVSLLNDWKEIIWLLRKERGLLTHIAFSASLFLIYQIVALAVVPVVDLRFGGDKYWLSILQGAFSLGCVVSVLAMKFWNDTTQAPYWMMAQALALGCLLISGNSGVFAAVIFLGMGVASSVASVQLMSRLMERCQREVQGRIGGLRFLLISVWITLLTPILTLIFGRGLDLGIFASTVLLGLFALVAIVVSSRRFLGDDFFGHPILAKEKSSVQSG